jgi:hypothetical protein
LYTIQHESCRLEGGRLDILLNRFKVQFLSSHSLIFFFLCAKRGMAERQTTLTFLIRAPLAGLWLLQKRLWLWLTRWSHFFRWAKAILKNHLAKRLIGCFSERPLYSFSEKSLLYVARDWGQDQKNNLDWWEGYCAKMTWAEAGWATFFGSCPLVHFGKVLHWWSHLKKRCLAKLLHEPEPKLKISSTKEALSSILVHTKKLITSRESTGRDG